jgi:hypothetical protein
MARATQETLPAAPQSPAAAARSAASTRSWCSTAGCWASSRAAAWRLKIRLGDDRHEGIDEDGQTKFFHELTATCSRWTGCIRGRPAPLRPEHRWPLAGITAQRNKLEGHELQMKYFQYLSLLFTEIYLDWYFNKRQELLDGLNAEMVRYRAESWRRAVPRL